MSARYEATVNTGMEWIAQDELKEKYAVSSTTQQGRIWFNTDIPVEKLLKLKSICNLYVVIYDTKLEDSEIPADKTCLEPLLMQVGERCDWETGLTKWRQVFNFTCCLDKLMTKNEEYKGEQPKFRVSCNRHGPTHGFTSPEVCSTFGHVIDTKFGWPIKMRDYDLEVYINININHLYVAMTLTNLALDRRNIVSPGLSTLRANLCYAILRLAKIEVSDVVCDPMAGSGAISVESCYAWPSEWQAYNLAGEIVRAPLDKCRANLNVFNNKPPSDILQLDVTSLPFRTNSIDVFVSDLPFGRRHGSKKNNRTLYPALMRELARASRVGTGRAVLLTQDIKGIKLAYNKNRDYFYETLCKFAKVGNLNCYINLFSRNNKIYDENKVTSDISVD